MAVGDTGHQCQRLLFARLPRHAPAGAPAPVEIIRRLRASDVAWATSLRGIWGFHGARAPHGDRFLSLRRHVPVVTLVVDSPERIARVFGIVDTLTADHGLITSEMVPASCAFDETERRGGLRLARHDY
jgi:PII-like signaling protein